MDTLAIENASFAYRKTPVFSNVNLSVPKGGTLCLLGPNGCGKTTLVGAMMGFHALSSGRIMLNGRNIADQSAGTIAKQVSYVPQKHTRHFSFSVMDILLMGRCAYTSFFDAPTEADRQLVSDLLRKFGLYHLKDRDYTLLSGGETQMMMILRALVQDTDIIIMDEPTAHLDFKHELVVLETIVRLIRQQGKTLVMATHFPNHAFYLENQGINITVAFMYGGKVEPTGVPSAALAPHHLKQVYSVETEILSKRIPGKGTYKQIIPIQTLKDK